MFQTLDKSYKGVRCTLREEEDRKIDTRGRTPGVMKEEESESEVTRKVRSFPRSQSKRPKTTNKEINIYLTSNIIRR